MAWKIVPSLHGDPHKKAVQNFIVDLIDKNLKKPEALRERPIDLMKKAQDFYWSKLSGGAAGGGGGFSGGGTSGGGAGDQFQQLTD